MVNKVLTGIGIGIFLLALLVGGSYFAVQESILSISNTYVKDDKAYWVVNLAPEGSGEKIYFTAKSNELKPISDSKGGKFVPRQGFYIEFDRELPYCEYQLRDDTIRMEKIFGFGLWKYYALSLTGENNAPIVIKPSEGDSIRVDGFKIGESTFVEKDSTGKLTIQVQGALMGKQSCPSGGNVAVSWDTRNGKIQGYYDTQGLRDRRNDFIAEFPDYGCTIVNSFTSLICKKPFDSLGRGTLTAVVDSEYLDAYYVPPTSGKPKIEKIEVTDVIEGKTSSIKVTVMNIGNNEGNFQLSSISSDFSFKPTTTNLNLKPNQKQDVYFVVVGKQVSKDLIGKGTFKLCTSSQFSSSDCVSSDFSTTIKNSGIVTPTNVCGNKVCETNENAQTCPFDCDTSQECNAPNTIFLNGMCQCKEGYSLIKDDYGRTTCDPLPNYLIYIIVGIFALIAILLITQPKKITPEIVRR